LSEKGEAFASRRRGAGKKMGRREEGSRNERRSVQSKTHLTGNLGEGKRIQKKGKKCNPKIIRRPLS